MGSKRIYPLQMIGSYIIFFWGGLIKWDILANAFNFLLDFL